MRFQLPHAPKGARVGLLGGSFDPPHDGHVHISEVALKRFGLDQVWWLVSPGNPLKSRGPASVSRRMAACRDLLTHPRLHAVDFETQVGTRYTAQTLEALFHHYRQVHFTWLMGADNLAGFHHWAHWEWIINNVPLGVIARPGQRGAARRSVAAQHFEHARLPGKLAGLLTRRPVPVWCLINAPMVKLSSSALREAGGWPQKAQKAQKTRTPQKAQTPQKTRTPQKTQTSQKTRQE